MVNVSIVWKELVLHAEAGLPAVVCAVVGATVLATLAVSVCGRVVVSQTRAPTVPQEADIRCVQLSSGVTVRINGAAGATQRR